MNKQGEEVKRIALIYNNCQNLNEKWKSLKTYFLFCLSFVFFSRMGEGREQTHVGIDAIVRLTIKHDLNESSIKRYEINCFRLNSKGFLALLNRYYVFIFDVKNKNALKTRSSWWHYPIFYGPNFLLLLLISYMSFARYWDCGQSQISGFQNTSWEI